MVGQRVDAMANPEHLAKLKEGVKAWNDWREKNFLDRADLAGVVLPQADLRGAHLWSANLTYSNLCGARMDKAQLLYADLTYAQLMGAGLHRAQLQSAILNSADLRGCDFSAADLRRVDLRASELTNANLRRADLREANLMSATLRSTLLAGANMAGAITGWTVFGDNDLETVVGLGDIDHHGPSTIGIDTIYQSKGQISEVFLRGCGVPENFIVFAKSLTSNPVEFYSCFISYSTKDQAFADRLYADLQNKGVRCWFAPHDVQGGKKLHEQIDEAIRLHDKLLLILSPHSMESEWVKTEIAKARKRELRDRRRVLFPIRLVPFETLRDWECFDADTGKDSAREIREYFIPDFSSWKDHGSYQEALQSLIRDLKASDAKPT